MKIFKKILVIIMCFSLCGCNVIKNSENVREEKSEKPETTPFGRYSKTVTYTLGKMTGANNSNMPSGDTYEDNAYTRYLKKKLNIQNKDAFEATEDDNYSEIVSLAIAEKKIPDVMVVNDIQILKLLVEEDLIEDLTPYYDKCTSKRIKEIYNSYGDEIFANATFDGKLMALPETNIDNGPNLLWLRKDWLDELGLSAPTNMDDVTSIIKTFVDKNMGKTSEGDTIGLVCDEELTGESGYSNEYKLDIVFAKYGAYPKNWIKNSEGEVVYGSIQPQVKKALKEIKKMYQEGILDKDFFIRGNNNIIEAITSGRCGAFFGPWWAPNNPLMEAMNKNQNANWMPYLIETSDDGSVSFVSQNPTSKYVVVRKGFKHPEIIMKIVSVLFDDLKYEDVDTNEIAQYYQNNVDPTARPLTINVDYKNALSRSYKNIFAALSGRKEHSDLGVLEGAYYNSCLAYQKKEIDTNYENWAAYTSRVTACSLLTSKKLKFVDTAFLGKTETMNLKWWKLEKLEKETFLKIISGEKPLSYFDEFVKEWYSEGGRQIEKEIEKNN